MSQNAPPANPVYQRKMRNYLLDAGMQVRFGIYTALAVLVTGGAIGWFWLRAQEEASQVQSLGDPELDAAIAAAMAQEDASNGWILVGGLIVVALALVLIAIKVTHKVAGPAFIMTKHARTIADGKLPFVRPLRQGDLLQELGGALREAVLELIAREKREAARLRELAEKLADPAGAAEVKLALETFASEKEKRAKDAE